MAQRMHFCFIDESGAGDPNPSNPYDVLVLAGVIVPKTRFVEFSERMDQLKSAFGLSRLDEIHACRMDNRIEAQNIDGFERMAWQDRRRAVEERWESELVSVEASKRAKVLERHERDRAFIHLTGVERLRLLTDACDLLGQIDSTVFISAVDRSQYSEPLHTYIPALLDLNYSFQKFRGNEPGTFIHDECNYKPMAKTVVKLYQETLNSKPGSCETISMLSIFADSRWTVGIQMADLCAYSVRKHLSSRGGFKLDSVTGPDYLFDRIEPLLPHPNHVTRSPCDCRICSRYQDDESS